MAPLLRGGAAYASMGSFHGESVSALMRAAALPDWRPPLLPAAVAAAVAAPAARAPFGRALKASHFLLDPAWTFVNHGAFGAPCAPALAAAAAWRAHAEAQPLRFIDRELFPHLAEATRRAASWLGAPPVEVALVQNATTGLNAVVPSVVHGLGAGDEVIILDVGYGSVATMLRRACAVSGARPVVVELLPALARLGSGGAPPTAAAVGEAALELVDRAMTPRTRLAIFDDITSNTALKLPCRALAELCRERGVLSLVDAAHGAASPRGVEALATADFVVGNLHKWACAPRGSAFLFAREAHHAALEPPVVSHGHGHGFHAAFAWSGAGDAAPLLSLSTLFDCFWRDAVGGPAAGSAYQQQLLAAACAHLCAAWGTNTLVDAADSGVHMALVELPPAPDGVTSKDVQDALHFQHRVECPVKTVHGRLYCRVSAALYNELADYEHLGEAVLDLLPRR